MASKVKRFTHTISLGAYPRALHNLKSCRSIYTKFLYHISKDPVLQAFSDKDELKVFNDFIKLEDVLTVHVIGKTDINDELLKVKPVKPKFTKDHKYSKKDLAEGMTATGLEIYLCYLQISNVDIKRFQKEVTETLSFLNSFTVTKEHVHESLLIVLEFGDKVKPTETAHEAFVATTQASAKTYFPTELPSSRFVSVTDEISSNISKWIESTYISENLWSMQFQLSRFDNYFRNKTSKKIDIVRSEEFIATLKGFLTNGHAFADMMQDIGKSPFVDHLLKYLKNVVRCALVKLASSKHALPEYICNSLAHKISLEEKFTNEISRNTKYKLKQMEDDCQAAYEANKDNDKYYQFPQKHSNIYSFITHDIEKVVAEFEDSILPVKKVATDLGKLSFELDALQQRIKPVAMQKIAPRVTYDMFEQISTLDYVFGVGTIYGCVEIHVTDCDMSRAEDDISDIFHEMDYHEPFRIRSVVDMPEPLFHQGAALQSDVVLNNETLGCFLTPENGIDLYAITCAHIFADTTDQRVVSVVTNGNLEPFAMSHPNLRFLSTNAQIPIIDFAALKVKDEVRAQCNLKLQDEDRQLINGMFSEEEVSVGSAVYKYGAGSGFSKGNVISNDYYIRGATEEEQLILIEPEYGGSYATGGDSGAVNCMTFLDGHDVFVRAISVISNGGFRLEGDPNEICVSFPFALPLGKISQRENMNLGFVRQ